MAIRETPKDDIELAHLIFSELNGSQRFPVPWTARLACRVIQQDALIKSLTDQVKALSDLIKLYQLYAER